MGSIINVKQPEFNLRSRLNELDYDRIPYEKMPPGTVIQHVYNVNNGSGHLTTTSGSWADLSFSVSITPHFSNSLMVIEWCATGQQPNTAVGGSAVTIYRNNTTNLGSTQHSAMGLGVVAEFGSSAAKYVTASNSFILYDEPGDRNPVSYHIWGKTTSSGTAYIAHSGVTRTLSVKEIRR